MDEKHIKEMLKDYKSGRLKEEEVISKLKKLPYEDIDYAKIDNHRSLRKGYGEVVYCAGKTPEQTANIFERMLCGRGRVLGTRADIKTYEAVKAKAHDAVYHKDARAITVIREDIDKNKGLILIATGGTSDIPVAEEAAITAEFMGNTVERLYDVGVAGIHRLLMNTDKLYSASVIIAVAGMEGALASVIGGLADCPVIAVPTSVGYGANFGGLSALLTMLNSCSSGIGVVNIDNGFGAGCLAAMINRDRK
ncbi:Pyridinium-3,5-biscarboxylic acid mononucleotide synthase [bioreactor metagenome]|uniref:Pyridinium-3,5-biscarboxylic acid mononucleotide synthase n=1 Tax=bioreactor metagenome TaxID=1076179 RepID=A0A645EIV0_9ZZZZ|nr:nickel pincer cofactor biosynthesis protein LarB [Lutispora sp.]MEA4963147.1 nickel pincer cofactor biosynthesis protein LarB [Lutispora sp.]HCJ57492.1 nickel pincer cofactor biosynthesis protein LarB [Clostridiaceae bacterium]